MNNATNKTISPNQKKRIEKVRKMKAIGMFILMVSITILSGIIMIRLGMEDATGLLIFMFIGDAYLIDGFQKKEGK